jgi:hypothetical protein
MKSTQNININLPHGFELTEKVYLFFVQIDLLVHRSLHHASRPLLANLVSLLFINTGRRDTQIHHISRSNPSSPPYVLHLVSIIGRES